MTKRQILLSFSLGMVGLAVWVTVSVISDKVEAWDSRSYYIVGLPISFAASGIAGFLEPERPWKWGIIVFIGQLIALLIQSKGNVALALVGLLFFLFLIAMAIGCAYLGRLIRRKLSKGF